MSPLYPPSTASRPAPPLTFGARVNRFWLRVTEGLALNQLWSQFEKDARASYRLYSKDLEARQPESVQPGRKFFHVAQQFFWAVLEKLTPPRRVLLLIALVLLTFNPQLEWHDQSSNIHIVSFDFRLLGGLLLFLLLILEVADRVVMKRDLEIAREIQTWLLPNEPPAIPGAEIAFETRPANTVAGDYYDVFARPGPTVENRVLLAVADVAGKSIPAAMLMATFQASLRTLSVTQSSLPELVASINRYACTNSQGGLRFTTAFLAELDPATRTLTYINAGHNHPMLCRKSGALERLDAGGLPIGIQAEAPYQSASVVLASGDWLVIFTDGVVEAMNTRGDEYGEPRLLAAVAAGSQTTPAEMMRRIMFDLDVFVGNTPQHDDVTCLLLKVV